MDSKFLRACAWFFVGSTWVALFLGVYFEHILMMHGVLALVFWSCVLLLSAAQSFASLGQPRPTSSESEA